MTLAMVDEESNRIVQRINEMARRIQDKIDSGKLTVEGVEKARKGMDFPFVDFVRFQRLAMIAGATGLITLSEGKTISDYLGSLPEIFNQQPIAVKAVLGSFFLELLKLMRGKP